MHGRKKTLFAIAIIIIAFPVVFAHTNGAYLHSADPNTYLQEINTLMQAEWPSNRAINIVCHGHSVPAGYFKTPVVDSLNAYPHILYESLKKKYPHAVINVIVTAIGGETSDKGERRFKDEVLAHKPDIILIDYCLNDRRIGLEKARIAWESMIKESLNQKIKIILLTPTGDTGAKLNDSNDPLNLHAAQVRTLAVRHNVALVDSLAEFKAYIEDDGKLQDLMSQGNHPNRKGHELVAKAIMEWFNCETNKVPMLKPENEVNVELTRDSSIPAIELPKWKGIGDEKLCDINMGGKDTNYKIWTGGNIKRFYPDEFLPALFRRTIVFNKSLDEDAVLQWKFTGPGAAFDIQISAETVTFKPRFYETPVYNEINGKAARHPEWSNVAKEWFYRGDAQAVTVQIDQGMDLSISLNGKLILERKWGFDISRHQIELGNEDNVSLELFGPKTVKAAVNVLPNKTHQKMIGFGGIATPTAYAQLSDEGKRQWWNWLYEYNLLIQREYPNGPRLNKSMDNWDNLKDATPHYYSSNFYDIAAP